MAKTSGPLAGLRIIDIGSIFAGPMIGTHLGDLGAEVIKIEPPNGDDVRRLGAVKNGVPLWWKLVARNKRLVGIDLRRPEGAQVLLRLAAQADIVVENFRPGKLESLGLGYDTLAQANPRIILLHISGYGRDGPYRNFPGFGTLAEAFSGFAYTNGQPDGPPTLPSFPIADHVTALFGSQSVLAAVLERERSGVGQEIELDLYECLLALMGNMVVNYDQLGEVMQRRGNRSKVSVPRNAYPTADGRWVVVSSTSNSVAKRLFQAIGRPDLANAPALATNQQRAEHADEIDSVMAQWIAARTQTEALATLQAHEVAAGPINDVAQFIADPQVQARQSVVEHHDPDLGPMRIPGVVPRFSRTPGSIRWTGRVDVGHDTRAVLGDAGYSHSEIDRLAADGVIVLPDLSPSA
jgi:crotonobetainyl-CoA:carnitine CoA-transferase CaiB-like acyl-CoA transferase